MTKKYIRKIGKDGRLTIPAAICKKLNLKKGSVLDSSFEEIDGQVCLVLTPVKKASSK